MDHIYVLVQLMRQEVLHDDDDPFTITYGRAREILSEETGKPINSFVDVNQKISLMFSLKMMTERLALQILPSLQKKQITPANPDAESEE